MKTKKDKLRFQRECARLVLRLGAEDREEYAGSRRYVLQTRLGELHLFPFDGWLATRFQDVDRAKAELNPKSEWGLRLNPYSGKWNFHFSDECTVQAALEFVEAEIRRILPA